MDMVPDRLELFSCPDCRVSVKWLDGERIQCPQCNRVFSATRGIWNFLPAAVAHREGKDRERQGWTDRDRQIGEVVPPEHWLTLPDGDSHPYYRAATWYLQIAGELARPWAGKNVLELGAAECWATRRFAELGANAIALDYDSCRMLRAQVILDSLPVRFVRVNGDAERLPFADGAMDTVFCCSVLHHFFDLPQAIREISRILKPGGLFLGIHEAFHPPHYSKERALGMTDDTAGNIQAGINEQSYAAAHYRKLFAAAGMKAEFLHPPWDTRTSPEGTLVVRQGIALDGCPPPRLTDFVRNSRGPRELAHRVAGFILRLGLWAAVKTGLFPLLRFQILNWTTWEKILVARKSATGRL